jgi:hypothetical protein
VIVNPTSAAVTVNMPGYVDLSGKSAYRITINPKDGVILKSSKWLTQITLTASTTTPAINQKVTFTAKPYWWNSATKKWLPVTGKPVTIWHYLNGVRYNDKTLYTDSSGKVTFTQVFGSAGKRTYYATFAGDSAYKTSTSSVVNVNVH